ncbi:MAG: ribonuclease HII [Muribaculaceae bacterium]|nr:ribonuclease HII [Muribaculaceae bacterium]
MQSIPNCNQFSINEAGCDEAGRGCLAGPVVAAAVILPDTFSHPWLNDSKQLTERRRELLRPIIEAEAIAWAVASCSPEEIDRINILNASILAMHRAIRNLKVRPGAIIVDGNRFKPYPGIASQTFVKGDSRFGNIAAASILAKTHRDEIMRNLATQYPHYNWSKNKGYPTPDHRAAIAQHGTTPHHRLTFRLLSTQLTLF